MKKWLSLLLTLTLFLGVLALSGTAVAQTATVTFSIPMVAVAAGKTATARASVTPYAANKKGVTYATSDESIATVNSKGVVTGVAAGECQLTATSKYDPTASATIPVKVVKPVTNLKVSVDSNALFVGKTLQLNVTFEPADATLQSATFSTSRDSVATVTANGLVTGVAKGSVKITATSADGYAKATVSLTVAQAPESIDVTPESAQGAAGKKAQLKATVLPSSANDKTVTWTSGDENVATVSSKGLVTFVSVGETAITATSNADAAVTASVPVRGLELAKSITFDNTQYSVLVGQTVQAVVNVAPESTTDKTVTYQVKNKRVATVDENGVVTGVGGGKTTLYAYTADGSKKRAATTIEVIVPVAGVSFKYKDVRVSANGYGSFTAAIQPSNATNKAMHWVSSDESIATVSGTTNRFKVSGRRWGRCKITGTTDDGNFTVEIYADVGALRHAVVATDVRIKNGKPYLTLRNQSDMDISQVRFEMLGYDQSLQPIAMSTQGDQLTLEGSYNPVLPSGASTSHGQFTFYRPSDYDGLDVLQFCVIGWSSSTGYYDSNGRLQHNYNIPEDKWEWITYPAGVNPLAR